MSDIYDMCQLLSATFTGRQVQVDRANGKLLGVYATDSVAAGCVIKVPTAVILSDTGWLRCDLLSESTVRIMPPAARKETT